MAIHIGSWGLPDLGISEWLGSKLGSGTTSQGGSNILGPDAYRGANNIISPVPSSQQVLGTNTQDMSSEWALPTAPSAPTSPSAPSAPSAPSSPSPEDIYRQQQISNISNKWDSYFSGLDQMMSGLPEQQNLLNQSANLQAGQQISDLTASTQENQQALNKQSEQNQTNQVKTLKDVSNNIRNLMQAGNTYLGSRGAGDSSAVNQYAYALTKLGSQQRGDVMAQTQQIQNDINDRIAKVGNVFTQEKNRINSELSQTINSISQWLVQQQDAIKQAKLQGGLDKSTDIQALTDNLYNIAVQKATSLQNAYQDKMAALQTWALNNSTTLKEAQSKLASAGSFLAPTPTYQNISGTPQFDQAGNMAVQYGGGFQALSDEEKRRLGLA